MGKASRWWRSLLGSKKSSESSPAGGLSESKQGKEKNTKWGRVKSSERSKGGSSSGPYVEGLDANKHAIAVAAATAAVAEAAIAAAQAAAEVVRLTSGNRSAAAVATGGIDRRREFAAIKIQSAFRAYLARRALRALRALVKLQALVRGRIVRKQSADMLRRMQAMARIQARACANRALVSETSRSGIKCSHYHMPGPENCKRQTVQQRSYGAKHEGQQLKKSGSKSKVNDNSRMEKMNSNWLDRWMEECTWNNYRDASRKNGCGDDEKSDKILEIDTWKPYIQPNRHEETFQVSQYFSAWNDTGQGFTTVDALTRQTANFQKVNPTPSSGEASLRSLNLPLEMDQVAAWTAENSPCVQSAASSRPGSSSRRGPLTPSRTEYARSMFGDYVGYPNYMANTESSRAKVRSLSAPRQRIQSDKHSTARHFGSGFWESDTMSEKGFPLHANFRGKAYPGSSRMDK